LISDPWDNITITDSDTLKTTARWENPNYFGTVTTNAARCTCGIKSMSLMPKTALNKKPLFHQQAGIKFEEETSEVLHMEHSFVRC
jgi:hypothetical protein